MTAKPKPPRTDPSALGDVIVERRFDPKTLRDRVVIVHADPIARVSRPLLDEIRDNTERGEDVYATLAGDVLTLRGDNRTVIYVVDWKSYDIQGDSFLMRWPD